MIDHVDKKLADAFHDVPVPEGLAGRLMARLNEEIGTKNEVRIVPTSSFLFPSSSRHWLVAGGGLLATAAVLFVAVWLGAHRGEQLTAQYVLDEAIRSFDRAADQPGQLLAEKPAPADYPFSVAVLQVRGTRWRPLDAFLGHQGVVYDLPGPSGTSATLYVVDIEAVEGVGEAPAFHPFTTAGCCASSWQEGGLLYVLVVQGDPATYRAYLNLPHGPMA